MISAILPLQQQWSINVIPSAIASPGSTIRIIIPFHPKFLGSGIRWDSEVGDGGGVGVGVSSYVFVPRSSTIASCLVQPTS